MRRKIKSHVPSIAPAARARSLTVQTAQKAKQAKLELLVIVPLMAVTVYAYVRRAELFGPGADTPVRVGAAVAMVGLGWLLARDIGRFAAPALFRRMDPATAGTVSFLIRLVMIAAAALSTTVLGTMIESWPCANVV